MAEITLTNNASIEANYGEESSPVTFSSNDVTTTIIEGLTITKAADKSYWVDGPLTYTIEVNNTSGAALSGGVITDILNTSLVTFSTTYGVQINGSATSNYTYNDGTLKVTLPDIANTEKATVTFQVTKNS